MVSGWKRRGACSCNLETIKAYLLDKVVHVEIVLEVALIAIARKVIILDLEKYSSLTVLTVIAMLFMKSSWLKSKNRTVYVCDLCDEHHCECIRK